jgi:hypothetical protein
LAHKQIQRAHHHPPLPGKLANHHRPGIDTLERAWHKQAIVFA